MAVNPLTRLHRVQHSSLVDVAAEALMEVVFDQAVDPGSRLSIDGTARLLNMSITPIREAMARLATQGLLLQDQNRGFSVAPLLTVSEFRDLFATRRILEHAALVGDSNEDGASLRLRNRNLVNDSQILAIRKIAEKMEGIGHGSKFRQFASFSRFDSEFHRKIVELSGNRFLVNSWCGMNFHMHVSRLYSGSGVIDYQDALDEHAVIVQALESRSSQRLISAARRHVLAAEKRLVQLLPTEEKREVAGL